MHKYRIPAGTKIIVADIQDGSGVIKTVTESFICYSAQLLDNRDQQNIYFTHKGFRILVAAREIYYEGKCND